MVQRKRPPTKRATPAKRKSPAPATEADRLDRIEKTLAEVLRRLDALEARFAAPPVAPVEPPVPPGAPTPAEDEPPTFIPDEPQPYGQPRRGPETGGPHAAAGPTIWEWRRIGWRRPFLAAYVLLLAGLIAALLADQPPLSIVGLATAASLSVLIVAARVRDDRIGAAAALGNAVVLASVLDSSATTETILLALALGGAALFIGAARAQTLTSGSAAVAFLVFTFAAMHPETSVTAFVATAGLALAIMFVGWWTRNEPLMATSGAASVVLAFALTQGALPVLAVAVAIALSLTLAALAASLGLALHGFLAVVLGHGVLGVSALTGTQPWLDAAGACFLLIAHSILLSRLAAPEPGATALAYGIPIITFGTTWAIGVAALAAYDLMWLVGPAAATAAALALLYAAAPFPRTRIRWSAFLTGSMFAIVWPALQFEGLTVPIVWASQLFLLALVMARRDPLPIRLLALGLSLLIGTHLLAVDATALARGHSHAWAAAAGFGVAAVSLWTAWHVSERRLQDIYYGRTYLGLALALPLVYFWFGMDGHAVSIAWSLQLVLVILLSLLTERTDLRPAALAIATLLTARVFFVDFAGAHLALRVALFLLVGASGIAVTWLVARRRRSVLRSLEREEAPAITGASSAGLGPKP